MCENQMSINAKSKPKPDKKNVKFESNPKLDFNRCAWI